MYRMQSRYQPQQGMMDDSFREQLARNGALQAQQAMQQASGALAQQPEPPQAPQIPQMSPVAEQPLYGQPAQGVQMSPAAPYPTIVDQVYDEYHRPQNRLNAVLQRYLGVLNGR